MNTAVEHSVAEVWERVIQPTRGDMTPEAARYFLQLHFDAADLSRMNQLAAAARAGSLMLEEQSELDSYMQVGWFLDLMKSKARLSLGERAAA